jgi:hypothetical protein
VTAIALTILQELGDLPYLTLSIELVDRRSKHYFQTPHLVRPPHLLFVCQYQDWMDARGITPENNQRLKFYFSLTWFFLLCFLFVFFYYGF